MCGRYTLSTPGDLVADLFGLTAPPELEPRFNIAPSQQVAIVRIPRAGAERELAMVRWGLVPHWAKDPAIGNRMINARAESLAEKPAFRGSLRRQRCLVVADGFYEWQAVEGKRKQPWHLRLAGGGPFGIAGLWARWADPAAGDLDSCTIITTTPNAVAEKVHDRMPAILDPVDFALWLDPEVGEAERVLPLLGPLPAERLEAWPVSLAVNSPANDREECKAPTNRARR